MSADRVVAKRSPAVNGGQEAERLSEQREEPAPRLTADPQVPLIFLSGRVARLSRWGPSTGAAHSPKKHGGVEMRRLIITLGVVGAMLAWTAPVAAHVSPGPGFGAHVSEMAPQHAIAHGSMFGQCVAAMARGACPHHEG
jgi:hypothetical protein